MTPISFHLNREIAPKRINGATTRTTTICWLTNVISDTWPAWSRSPPKTTSIQTSKTPMLLTKRG